MRAVKQYNLDPSLLRQIETNPDKISQKDLFKLGERLLPDFYVKPGDLDQDDLVLLVQYLEELIKYKSITIDTSSVFGVKHYLTAIAVLKHIEQLLVTSRLDRTTRLEYELLEKRLERVIEEAPTSLSDIINSGVDLSFAKECLLFLYESTLELESWNDKFNSHITDISRRAVNSKHNNLAHIMFLIDLASVVSLNSTTQIHFCHAVVTLIDRLPPKEAKFFALTAIINTFITDQKHSYAYARFVFMATKAQRRDTQEIFAQLLLAAFKAKPQQFSNSTLTLAYDNGVILKDYPHFSAQCRKFLEKYNPELGSSFPLGISAFTLNNIWAEESAAINRDALRTLICHNFTTPNANLSTKDIKDITRLLKSLHQLELKGKSAMQTVDAKLIQPKFLHVTNVIREYMDKAYYAGGEPVRFNIKGFGRYAGNEFVYCDLYFSIKYANGKYVLYDTNLPNDSLEFEYQEADLIASHVFSICKRNFLAYKGEQEYKKHQKISIKDFEPVMRCTQYTAKTNRPGDSLIFGVMRKFSASEPGYETDRGLEFPNIVAGFPRAATHSVFPTGNISPRTVATSTQTTPSPSPIGTPTPI